MMRIESIGRISNKDWERIKEETYHPIYYTELFLIKLSGLQHSDCVELFLTWVPKPNLTREKIKIPEENEWEKAKKMVIYWLKAKCVFISYSIPQKVGGFPAEPEKQERG